MVVMAVVMGGQVSEWLMRRIRNFSPKEKRAGPGDLAAGEP